MKPFKIGDKVKCAEFNLLDGGIVHAQCFDPNGNHLIIVSLDPLKGFYTSPAQTTYISTMVADASLLKHWVD